MIFHVYCESARFYCHMTSGLTLNTTQVLVARKSLFFIFRNNTTATELIILFIALVLDII